jgi:hypothetical protein
MTEICKLTLSKLNIVVALISTVIIKMTPAIFIYSDIIMNIVIIFSNMKIVLILQKKMELAAGRH